MIFRIRHRAHATARRRTRAWEGILSIFYLIKDAISYEELTLQDYFVKVIFKVKASLPLKSFVLWLWLGACR
jgi:hypothetical protein